MQQLADQPLIEALRLILGGDRSALAERWIDQAARCCWALRLAPAQRSQLQARCVTVLEALAEGLAQSSTLATGTPSWRESIQRLAFLAGWIAGQQWPLGAVLALAHALRDVLALPAPLADDFALVLAEAHASGLRDQALARRRALLTRSQLVCLLRPSLAALWLVGDPDAAALDDALGRWLMLAVIHDARYLLVDVALGEAPAPLLELALRRLVELVEQGESLAGRQIWVVMPEGDQALASCAAATGLPVRAVESVAEALATPAAGA
ncbi:MAG: hypothetical protein IPL40_10225 [Proteobacteria bacterium]|nr:hypothetical protein [Pseudomonadota bacterium]